MTRDPKTQETGRDFIVSDRTSGQIYCYRPRQILVGRGDEDLVADRLSEWKAERKDELAGGAIVRWMLPAKMASKVPQIVDELRKPVDGRVPVVAPNHVMFGSGHMLMGPYGLPEVAGQRNALPPVAGAAGEGVRIGIVDTGVVHHPWLVGRLAPQSDIEVLPAGHLGSSAGHGTFVAGVLLLHAPGATVEVQAVADASGATDDVAVAEGLRELHDPDIVCLSVGGYTHDGMPPPVSFLALQELKAKNLDLVVVACAGNDYTDRPFYPAAWDEVIAVASLDDTKTRSSFSNYGPWVDCGARGERVHSCYVRGTLVDDSGAIRTFDRWARWSGTSFAAPRVAGIIAAERRDGESMTKAAYRVVYDPSLPKLSGVGTVVDRPEAA